MCPPSSGNKGAVLQLTWYRCEGLNFWWGCVWGVATGEEQVVNIQLGMNQEIMNHYTRRSGKLAYPSHVKSHIKTCLIGILITHMRLLPPRRGWLNSLCEPSKQLWRIEKLKTHINGWWTFFLLSYCTTPHTTANSSPCETYVQRSLQTRFDLLRLEVEETVCQKQADRRKTITFILAHMNSSLDNESWYVIWGLVHIGCREQS